MADSDEETMETSHGNEEKMDDTSDSSSDEEQEIAKEQELEQKAKILEQRLEANIYDYDAYVELVHIKRELTDLTGLRKVFEAFSTQYPLTADLWLLWIKSEVAIASSDDDRKRITELFEKGVQDYLSVKLWLEYVQFAMGHYKTDEVRQLGERALSSAGLHVTQGSLIWDALREFELAHLSLNTNIESEEWDVQAQRVVTLFKRQLGVPLNDMELTFEELQSWISELPKQNVVKNMEELEQLFRSSQTYLKKITPFEESLLMSQSESDKVSNYYKYLEFEKTNPIRVNILFERAVADIALNPELWRKYCMHALQLGPDSFAISVCKKSIRNCTWNPNIWTYYLQTLEYFGRGHEEVTKEFESALLACGSDGHSQYTLWMCYLEHCRRLVTNYLLKNIPTNGVNTMETETQETKKVEFDGEFLRKIFSRAVEHLTQIWGNDADPSCNILQFWARLEASVLNDIEAARRIWTNIFREGHSQTASLWLEYLKLELRYGDEKHIRKTYVKALNATKDWPQSIAESWMNYERDNGTIQQIMDCNTKCFNILQSIKPQAPTQETSRDKDKPKRLETKTRSRSGERKRKLQEMRPPIEKKKPKPVQTDLTALAQLKLKDENQEMTPEVEARTIFISNLDYSVTEDRILEFFGNKVKSLRLVKDFKGRSKGFGYVELNSPEEVVESLKRDRERIDSRPVFLSMCKSSKEKREKVFKYSTTREQNKLFVKGLPFTITEAEVKKFFEPYGEIKDIRMVCYRNGHFKGIAYVEYVNAADTSKALVKTDNTEIDGHTISVAISNPPQRNLRDAGDTGFKEPQIRKSRLQVPLVPTVLKKTTSKPESASTSTTSKSNDDFRKMLLK